MDNMASSQLAAVVVAFAAAAAAAAGRPAAAQVRDIPAGPVSIDAYGAVSGVDTVGAARTNSRALAEALAAASPGGTVLVPSNGTYYVQSASAAGLSDVTLLLEGTLVASNNITAWPVGADGSRSDVISVANSTGVTFRGGGTIDGQGHDWWWAKILGKLGNRTGSRPHLLACTLCRGLVVDGITLNNSPNYHVRAYQVQNVTISGVTIYVDNHVQREMYERAGVWDEERGVLGVPNVFALNTDGIDLRGCDIEVFNVTIQNFDDAVVPKPTARGSNPWCSCTERVHVHDISVRYSVGMSIGSVPPAVGDNCVADVVFERVVMRDPLKAIYVKTNPGDSGTGTIRNITYRDFTVSAPTWWPIYIGPQQQGLVEGGPGCIFYPLNPVCPTQPLVTVSDIFLSNVTITDALLWPGLVRCNATNPCSNIVFDDVTVSGGLAADGYFCQNADVVSTGKTSPAVRCKNSPSSHPAAGSPLLA